MAAARRDLPAARSIWLKLREQHGDGPYWRRLSTMAPAGESEKQGRLADARRLSQEAMTDGENAKQPADYLVTAAQPTLLDVSDGRPGGEALAPLAQALARRPLQSLDPPHRDADALAAWQSDYEEAGTCGVCGPYEIASAQARLGHPDSALAAYERIATQPSLESASRPERYTLAPTYERLGEPCEAKQDRRKAADYHGRFVDLYQHADPELQPGVREVRERLARLAREPAS